MRNGRPVTSESASAVRRICPPPSPSEPSIVIHSVMVSYPIADTGRRQTIRETFLMLYPLSYRRLRDEPDSNRRLSSDM